MTEKMPVGNSRGRIKEIMGIEEEKVNMPRSQQIQIRKLSLLHLSG